MKKILLILLSFVSMNTASAASNDEFKTARIQHLYEEAEKNIYKEKALDYVERLMAEAEQSKDTLAMTEAYVDEAYIYSIQKHNPVKAQTVLRELKERFPNQKDAIFNAYRYIIYGYQYNGKMHMAMYIAKDMAKVSQEPKWIIEANYAIFEMYKDMGNLDMAEKTILTLCNYIDNNYSADSIKNAHMAAAMFTEAAINTTKMGMSKLAWHYLQRASDLVENYDDKSLPCFKTFSQDFLWFAYGKYYLSDPVVEQNITYARKQFQSYLDKLKNEGADDADSHRYYYNLMFSYYQSSGQWRKALVAQDSLAQATQQLGINPYNELYYTDRATLLENQGKLQEALDCYQRYVSVNDSNRLGDALNNLEEFAQVLNVHSLEQNASRLRETLNKKKLQIAYLMVGAAVLLLILSGVIIFILINSRRKLKDAYQQTKEALGIKTKFINNIHHEVRTPLNAILGFSQVLASMVEEKEECKQMTDIIGKNGMQLAAIIDDIIAVAEMESRQVKIMPFDVSKALEKIVKDMHDAMPDSRKFVIKPEEGNSRRLFASDETLVNHAVRLVMANAIKFADEGDVEIAYRHLGDTLTIRISDKGPGVPIEKQEWVFEQFTKGNDFVPGTGMGLSLCRNIARRLGGDAYIDSSYVEGCRVVLQFTARKSL